MTETTGSGADKVSLPDSTSHRFAATVLGFALGGFFDGILLHQVLQWHHFLSLVPGEQYQNLEAQVLADGLFHIAIYMIAIAALLMLWRHGDRRPADRILLAWAVLGFSIWQFVDVVLVHWVVGIHRVRVGVPNPLLWDLGWLVVFGVTSLVLGIWLLVRSGTDGGGHGQRATALISSAVIIGAVGTLAPSEGSATAVLFRPDMLPAETFEAAAALDARVMWSDRSARLLVLDLPPTARSWTLYTQGALLVGNTGVVGCLNGTRA